MHTNQGSPKFAILRRTIFAQRRNIFERARNQRKIRGISTAEDIAVGFFHSCCKNIGLLNAYLLLKKFIGPRLQKVHYDSLAIYCTPDTHLGKVHTDGVVMPCSITDLGQLPTPLSWLENIQVDVGCRLLTQQHHQATVVDVH